MSQVRGAHAMEIEIILQLPLFLLLLLLARLRPLLRFFFCLTRPDKSRSAVIHPKCTCTCGLPLPSAQHLSMLCISSNEIMQQSTSNIEAQRNRESDRPPPSVCYPLYCRCRPGGLRGAAMLLVSR